MIYYVPQPIAVYPMMEMQGFRKGNCDPYENRVLANSNVYKFTNIMIKRANDGGTSPTVTFVDLNDSDIEVVVPPDYSNYDLDNPDNDLQMLVLEAGNWTTGPSIASGLYYLRIEAGVNTWYTEAIYIEQVGSSTFPLCDGDWIKLSWTDGRCIVADTNNNNVPILAYPDAEHTFFLFLRGNLSQPEWEYEEDGEKDANKVFVAQSRRLAKKWKIEGWPVSETIVDALNSSILFETVNVELQSGVVFSAIKDIEIENNWEQGGCLAICKYNFTTDYLLKQGCC